MRPTGRLSSVIVTPRLQLVDLDSETLLGVAGGDADLLARRFGWSNPDGLLCGEESWLSALFGERLRNGPEHETWLLRAMVETSTSSLIGHIGFHLAPDSQQRVEVGYSVVARRQRRGLAKEALRGLAGDALASGTVRTVRASVSPTNEASLGVVHSLDFRRVGEQIDEENGLEWIYEIPVADLVESRLRLARA